LKQNRGLVMNSISSAKLVSLQWSCRVERGNFFSRKRRHQLRFGVRKINKNSLWLGFFFSSSSTRELGFLPVVYYNSSSARGSFRRSDNNGIIKLRYLIFCFRKNNFIWLYFMSNLSDYSLNSLYFKGSYFKCLLLKKG